MSQRWGFGYGQSSGDITDDYKFKMADWQPFCFAISFFANNSKTNRDSDFVLVSKMGFGAMTNLVVILPLMSDSKWPTGGHFCSAFSTILLITSKQIEIDTSF